MSTRELYAEFAREIDIETLIVSAFEIYKSKNASNKYNSNDNIPQKLIKLYYGSDNEQSDFSEIMETFKEKYIIQESKLEGVHNIEEINGLGIVYDFIRSENWKICKNIYIILLIHAKLFSLTPYPEFGGALRNSDCYIEGSKVQTTPYYKISSEVQNLWSEFDRLMKTGMVLSENKNHSNDDNIITYINECLKLKCRLIEIHPFPDGNGRTMRALTNLLFKIAGLPPVYVKHAERKKYIEAMDRAIVENDYEAINKFYYYKICDSIVELDINQRRKKGKKKERKPE